MVVRLLREAGWMANLGGGSCLAGYFGESMKNFDYKKLDSTIKGEFSDSQIEYMKKTGISADRFRKVAELGKIWLQSREAK